MGLHHMKLKGAIKEYGPLVTEGKTEEEIRSAISANEALAPFVDEIYAAIAPKDPELVDHIVTKEDLENNPELAENGVQIGDTIQIPQQSAENPSEAPAKVKKPKGHIVLSPFRDKDDFAKAYEEGDDVSHFDESRKADLVERGLIEAI